MSGLRGAVLRRSVAASAIPAFLLVIVSHLALRPDGWTHEWYWTFDSFNFVTILLAPVVAGVATWEGASWSATAESARSSGRVGSVVVWAWVPTAAISSAVFLAGAVAAGVMTSMSGTPGLPGLAEVFALAPGVGLLCLCSAIGVAVGWVMGRALLAPVVSIAVFALLFAGYTVLPNHLFRIGGATGSLMSLAPRTPVHVLQLGFYLLSSAAILAGVVRHAQPPSDRGRAFIPVSAAALSSALVLTFIGGLRFVDHPAELVCRGESPEVCLGPGYDHLRESISDVLTEPFALLTTAGFAAPTRVTQDLLDNAPGALRVGTRPPAKDDVHDLLVFAIIPPDCDVFRDEATYSDYSTVWSWVGALLGLDTGIVPNADPVVARGDSAASRRIIHDISDRLQTCHSSG